MNNEVRMENDYFENVFDKENLSEMLKAFHYTTGLATYLMSVNGEIILQYGPTYPYCTFVYSHIPESICQEVRVSAGKRAMEIGSSYIFSCHANLNHIAFPIIYKGSFLGSIQVGPFLMNAPDSSLVMDIRDRYGEFSMQDLLTLYDDAADIPQVSAEKVTQLSRLFYFLMSSLVTDSKDRFIINQKKLTQQSKINEAIQMYKNAEPQLIIPYPVEKEKAMLSLIKEGNVKAAGDALSELLGYLFLLHGNNISAMRFRVIELGAVMIHTVLEYVEDSRKLFSLSDHFIHRVPGIPDLDELSYVMSEFLENIMECMLPTGSENNRLISQVIEYIAVHYSEPLTLQSVAEYISLNPSYLSRLFKQVIGMTFKEYLTFVRIEEAKRLLSYTDFPIIDIAVAVGFESQSYFSQVFKKTTGIAPNKYRR